MSLSAVGKPGAVALVVFLGACGGDGEAGGQQMGPSSGWGPIPSGDNAAGTNNGVTTSSVGPSAEPTGVPAMVDSGNMVGSSEPPGQPAPDANQGFPGMLDTGGNLPLAGMGGPDTGMTGTEGMAGVGTMGTGMMGMDNTDVPDPMAGPGGSDDAAGGSPNGGPLMFTGEFTATDGAIIEDKYKCPMPFGGGMGQNISPLLEWSGGPAGTMSFGLVLYDTGYDMLHWVVWDIPVSATSLPEGLPAGFDIPEPAGAHQAAAMGSDDHAYAGPCSAGAIAARAQYEYRLYALDTAMLELTETSSAAAAQAAIEAAALGSVVWSGKTQ